MKAGRRHALDQIDVNNDTFATMKQTLIKAADGWIELDETAYVDLAFMTEDVQPQISQKVIDDTLALFPTQDNKAELQDVVVDKYIRCEKSN